MDDLRERADVFFVLTTNQPETLEPALASRPGRIDQAIAFPLPDETLRRRLIALYAKSLPVSSSLNADLARRTDRASPAFIKELMRRIAQHHLERGTKGEVRPELAEAALHEMLFSGGVLNAKLLGGAGTEGWRGIANSRLLRGCRRSKPDSIRLLGGQVVTGANGSGKSNLYRALRLVAQAAEGRLAEALATEGGIPSVQWAGPEGLLGQIRRGVPIQGTARKSPLRIRFGFATEALLTALGPEHVHLGAQCVIARWGLKEVQSKATGRRTETG